MTEGPLMLVSVGKRLGQYRVFHRFKSSGNRVSSRTGS
jgi:hypothetical protein